MLPWLLINQDYDENISNKTSQNIIKLNIHTYLFVHLWYFK